MLSLFRRSAVSLRHKCARSLSGASPSVPLPTSESSTTLKLLCAEARTSLASVRDLLRFCTTRLTKSPAFFGHGGDSYEEALFLVSHSIRVQPNLLEPMADARLTQSEVTEILDLLSARIQQRVPLAYLASCGVLGENLFFVDKRVIVPRSYIAEILRTDLTPFLPGGGADGVKHVLDLCTGSGCLVR
jgi:ribosomal protein L3 glutamine methyltransferase